MRSGAASIVLLLAACAGTARPAPAVPDVAAPAEVEAAAEPAAPAPEAEDCGMDVRRLVGQELERRPLAAEVDVYKLVHQAVLGPGHSIGDPVRGRAMLARELELAGEPEVGEPIVEDLDETTGTVRLNLRKWKFVRGTPEELWPVVAASARDLPEDRGRVAICLEEAARVLPELGRDAGPFFDLVARMAGQGYPPVSHGDAYRAAYRPAYRVVLRRLLPPWVTAPPPNAG